MPIDAAEAITKVNAANGSTRLRFIPASASNSRVCVQRPDASEHGKSEKQHGKCPRLQMRRELELRQLPQIQRASRYVGYKDPHEHKHAPKKGVQRQLHCAVFLVGRAEDSDEKIFRHDHQLVEHEEQK